MFPKILPVLAMAANRFFDTSRKVYEVKKGKTVKGKY